MTNFKDLINQIKTIAKLVGISSSEVTFAKDLVNNKIKNNSSFICEGLWANQKLISKQIKVSHFFICAEKLEAMQNESELENLLEMAKYAENTYLISGKACKKISDRDGEDLFFVIAKYKTLTLDSLSKIIDKKPNVMGMITDGLEQPGNVGAILRSFDSAGGDFAIIVNAKAKLTNSRLVRASLGASFMLPTLEADIADVQNWLIKNKFRCVATDLTATKSYREVDPNGRLVIVAGGEHTGISNSWRTLPSTECVIIPMLGSVESLNVGFASTLVAYDIGLRREGK